jgi:Arc/MetJ family transcription regulator
MLRKTTLEVDDQLFKRTRNVLGTKGLKATVRRALEEVLALDARRQAKAQLETMTGLEQDNAGVMAAAWR